jgi:hypothetical protein
MKIRTGEAFPGLRQINASDHYAPKQRVPTGTMKNAGLYENIRVNTSARVLPLISGPDIRAASGSCIFFGNHTGSGFDARERGC